jgi:putative flippase GtrA
VRFFLVGILNTALDIGLYLVLTRWFGVFATRKVVAKGISYGAGIVNSFYWNKSWTFKAEAGAVAFVAFVAASLTAMAINAGTMYLSLKVFNLHEGFALALATGSSFIWNFTISKCFIFKKRSTRRGIIEIGWRRKVTLTRP